MVDSSKAGHGAGKDRAAVDPDAQPGGESDLSIEQLVSEHYQSVYRYAYRLSGSANDAEDLTQQAFMIAQQKLHQVRELGKVDRWLFAVLRSCFLKSRRRQRPTNAATIELNVDEIPAEKNDSEVDEERLQAAIDDLPENFRVVVLMYYFEQLSYKEIAATLEISIGTVMSRLSRAKGRIRQRLFRLTDLAAPADHSADTSTYLV